MDNLYLKIPPAIVFLLCLALIYLMDQYSPGIIAIDFPRWIVIIPAAAGAALGAAGVLQFVLRSTTVNPHKPANASTLITSGVYRFTRNPMYLGLLLLLIAGLFRFSTLPGLLAIPLFIIYMNRFQIIPEETAMQKKFGDEFADYKERVRRWV